MLFNDVVSIASTSWHSFLVGATTMYKLARLMGHRPVVPCEFRDWCFRFLMEFNCDARIDVLALDLLYLLLIGSYNARGLTGKLNGNYLLLPGVEGSLILDAVTYMVHAHDDADDDVELKMEHVEHAIQLHVRRACPTAKQVKVLYKLDCAQFDNEELDPDFEPR